MPQKARKLERWGDYMLVPPGSANDRYSQTAEGVEKTKCTLSSILQGRWRMEFFDLPKQWDIAYKGFDIPHLQPFSFKHTGLFPEQAVNWDWFSEKIKNVKGRQD